MNKKGFTLVELLAVIAILAILVIIALPNVIEMFNRAKKELFLTEAKNVYREVAKKYTTESMRGNNATTISNDTNSLQLSTSSLVYIAKLTNKGKINHFQVSNGEFCISGKFDSTNELTIDKITDGECEKINDNPIDVPTPDPVYCTFDGELKQGAEYVNGQYTYRYKQTGVSATTTAPYWINMSIDGWGVQLTDRVSTNPVTSKLCTYINDKPIVSMSHMFYKSNAASLDLSSFDTSNVTNMSSMFADSKATILNVSNFVTSNVTDMGGMFSGSNATSIDVSNFDTSKVADMYNMFYGSNASLLDLSNFNTSNVTDMSGMFFINQATTINLSGFDTSKVTNMNAMFYGSNATTIKGLESFDTSNVTDMNNMFAHMRNIQKIDVSNFDTSNVTSMRAMFSENRSTVINGLENFNTSKVTDMQYMFFYSGVSTLDLSSFDTSNVTDMYKMFSEAFSLKTIYVSNKFSTVSVTDSTDMFLKATKLVGGSGTTYNSSNVDKTYARIDGGTSSPGYFTSK